MAKYGLTILLLVEIAAAFWMLPEAITVKNNLAAWPRSGAAQKAAEVLIKKPDSIRRQISQWERWLTENNEARDVLLKLSLLSYQIYQDEQAKTFWQRAFYLDPQLVSSLPQLAEP